MFNKLVVIAIISALVLSGPGRVEAGEKGADKLDPSIMPDSGIDIGSLDSPGPALEWLGATQATLQAVGAASTTPEASGRVFYVSNNGSNAHDGSENSPWSSIRYAVSQLQAGDTLYIQEGVYAEGVDLQASGTADAWITIEGIGNVVIDGRSLVDGRLASDPIQGDPDLQEVVDELGNKSAYHTDAAFDTNGHSYIRFRNLTVNRMSSGVEVSAGSSHIDIDGLRTDGNRFAVRISDASDVSVRNVLALNSWNAFRAEGNSHDLFFENIEVRGSKDVWDGMDAGYLNGDGFILEAGFHDVVMRHIVSKDNWDAGFDIKASNVLLEFVEASGNKNNFKVWGDGITIRNSISHDARSQHLSGGPVVEGNGLTVESGARNILLQNVTLADNEAYDIRMYEDSQLRIEDSIVARRSSSGGVFKQSSNTTFSSTRVLWYIKGKSKPSSLKLGSGDKWTDPKFLDWTGGNYLLNTKSPGWGKASGGGNLGAYEYQKTSGESPGLLYPF